MQKILINLLLCFFSVVANATDCYNYSLGKDSQGNTWYINLTSEYLSLSSTRYDFWYKVVNSKKKELSSGRVLMDLKTKKMCYSDYNDFINPAKSGSQDCDSSNRLWYSYSPDSMFALIKRTLDAASISAKYNKPPCPWCCY